MYNRAHNSVCRAEVAIAKCKDPHDRDSVADSVEGLFELLGGLRSIVTQGDTVVIKPNVGFVRDYRIGANTNPAVVRAIALLSREAGARKVIIAEGAVCGASTQDTFRAAGFASLAEELGGLGVELLDLKVTERRAVPVPGGRVARRLKVPLVILEADVIINVPAMKTHDAFEVTLGIKNMKGILSDPDKKRFHKWGLSQGIVDLNKAISPDLTILDGTVAMEGMGPGRGDPVNLGVLIASTDVVAGDVVAATVMGFEPREVEYIGLAADQGLGCGNLACIDILGLQISDVRRPFRRYCMDAEALKTHGISIVESGACTGCKFMVEGLLGRLEQGSRLDVLAGKTIVFGQTAVVPPGSAENLVLIGRCLKDRKGAGFFIPGCPPHPEVIVEVLKLKP